jgi:Bacterial alpha-L-rhamnosidase 6 hairpin glycosidase domain/Alpha-L-rhamnosidase N-terminal domain/Bacterial alpha-L-rhamnosidase concanavalin-like domain/Bacterial alpha-L-rhamnosidase C-terminal domain
MSFFPQYANNVEIFGKGRLIEFNAINMKPLKSIFVLVVLTLISVPSNVIGKIITTTATTAIQKLRCEYLVDPIGIGATNPRLSWIITSDKRSETQKAYRILVASSPRLLDQNNGDLWDTGRVLSDHTTQISYEGRPLVAREDCYWKVRIWDQNGRSTWSPVAKWEMGLLKPGDWTAKWISAGTPSTNPAAHLVIIRATYEATDGGDATDVTSVLVHDIEDNRLVMRVDNETLGSDLAHNHPKQLRVQYEFDGKTYTNVVDENGTLAIPKGALTLPYLRKDFDLSRSVRRAVLYVTAMGLYEVDINGHRVGNHLFAPDWTDYNKRVRYQAYDVTPLIQRGDNAIAAILANGWYSGHIGNGGYQLYGKVPALLAQLEVTYADGSTKTIVTDSSWKSHPSPILSADIMMGEDYDARRQVKGWDKPGLNETGWVPAQVRHEPSVILCSQVTQPIRELCELKPKKLTEPEPGHWIYDLGQNMVGVARIKISAPAGTEITIRQGEMLNPNGTLYTKNLRGAKATDHYTCKGTGLKTWQPCFTYHGFRYVELTGLPANPGTNAVTGIVIGSATPQAGEFTCSDPQINQLESNIQWSQRGNYFGIPTDCPQRDERMGWMGDAEVFIRTATYNADVAAFFTKWLVDVDDAQSPDGAFSDVSPNDHPGRPGAPGWGDAGVICPWTIYKVYGDKRILEHDLPAMIKWVNFLRRHSDNLIRDRDRGNDYGDWLSIHADTPKDLIGTAYFAYSTHLVAKSCAALGRTNDATKYETLFQDIKAAFIKKYVSTDGHVEGNTQTAYALALKFDLLPDNLRTKAAQYLVDDIKSRGWHLSTGFLGVGYLLPVLAQADKTETAYRLLLQNTYPSWLFPVEHGATTIWERWDGWTPDKGFENPEMNSFNHYALGSCGQFLFADIGGIRPASPGYKSILIDPVIGEGLTWAKTSYDSIHGRIATYWKIEGNQLSLQVTVPANTTATICIPAKNVADVTEGGNPIGQVEDVQFLRQEGSRVLLKIGSGNYKFVSDTR